MGTTHPQHLLRRRLLQWLLAAPALASMPREIWAQAAAADEPQLAQLLNVLEFEAVARAKLPVAHFGYLATGADDGRTVLLNHEAYSHLQIRSHRFVDVSRLDTTRTVFGKPWAAPLYLSAVSGMRAFHPEAEPAAARAAATHKLPFMASSFASAAPQDIAAARGEPIWQQIYSTNDWNITRKVIERAESMGSTAIALTVDLMPGRNTETMFRAMRADTRDCKACHVNGEHEPTRRAALYAGLDVSKATEDFPSAVNWDYLKRVRELVQGKLLIKGIVTGEDAALCLQHGADGIIVSNHGGRDEETLRPTIECLPEVVAAVKGRAPVFIDGGIRRGTDIFKALALGATAVGIGRPYAWGLAGFGQPGVEAVLGILLRELRAIMRQAGTPALAAIQPASVSWSRY